MTRDPADEFAATSDAEYYVGADTFVRARIASICLGTRVRFKKGGAIGTVQFESELIAFPGSTGARLGVAPIIALEVVTDDGVVHWPLTADDVEVLP